MIALRPYQVAVVDEVRARAVEGHKKILVVAPTGAGKGTLAAHFIEAARGLGRRSLFVAHRRELLKQLHDRVPWAGYIAAGKEPSPAALCQVASVPTLARREKPAADLVVVDEAHHLPSESWSKVVAEYPDATVLGFTATPIRLDRRGLGDHFTALVEAARPDQLIADGFLSPFEAFAFDAPQLHDVGTRAGDFKSNDLALACNTSILVGNAVNEYVEHARGRRAIAFAVNIEHSMRICGEFQDQGVRAQHVDGETPETEREKALEDFEAGRLDVIVNVGLFTEGLDVPAAEVCLMLRPTMSEGMCLQMMGRVLRPMPGKTALILDCAGNLLRHGLPDERREWSLQSTPKRVAELHSCPFCRQVFGRLEDNGSCPKCGEIIAPPREVREENERRKKEQLEGERINAERIKELRRQRDAAVPESKKIAYYLQLQRDARQKGYKPTWAGIRFKLRYGYWPRFSSEQIAAARQESVA
jgi:DNA repair protein RadD